MVSLSFSLTGCGDVGSNIKSFLKGDVVGEMNKTYSTQWFDFTIKSIKSAYVYENYEVEEGYKFVLVRVSETNTFHEPIPMSCSDFYLDAVGIIEEDKYPYSPFEDEDSMMMPAEFTLSLNETVEYDVVFSIPDNIMEISFIYEEIDIEENIGATFTIKHSL